MKLALVEIANESSADYDPRYYLIEPEHSLEEIAREMSTNLELELNSVKDDGWMGIRPEYVVRAKISMADPEYALVAKCVKAPTHLLPKITITVKEKDGSMI